METLETMIRDHGGVLTARGDRTLARRLERLAERGALCSVAPGIYLPADRRHDLELRIAAAACWAPTGVLTGTAAARLTFWPDVTVRTITLSGPIGRRAVPGLVLHREHIPAVLRTAAPVPFQDLTVTVPAVTALDLGGEGIDRALLAGAATLEEMHEALRLTPNRTGNLERRRLLHDSRDEPWSAAERLGHAVFRSGGITGWRSNLEVRCGSALYYVDVGWRHLKLAAEIDGYAYHSDREQFERDRRKWSDLTARGWRIIHLTWNQLHHDPAWVLDTVRRALSQI